MTKTYGNTLGFHHRIKNFNYKVEKKTNVFN